MGMISRQVQRDSDKKQEFFRKPFHESIIERLMAMLGVLMIVPANAKAYAEDVCKTLLDVLNRTRVPADQLPEFTKALDQLRVHHQKVMPVFLVVLFEQSVKLLCTYQMEMMLNGYIAEEVLYFPEDYDNLAEPPL